MFDLKLFCRRTSAPCWWHVTLIHLKHIVRYCDYSELIYLVRLHNGREHTTQATQFHNLINLNALKMLLFLDCFNDLFIW